MGLGLMVLDKGAAPSSVSSCWFLSALHMKLHPDVPRDAYPPCEGAKQVAWVYQSP